LGFNFSKRLFHYPDPNLVKTKFRTFGPNTPNPSLELVPKLPQYLELDNTAFYQYGAVLFYFFQFFNVAKVTIINNKI
jgi:hypothetical protein